MPAYEPTDGDDGSGSDDDGDEDDAATEALTASYLMDAEFDSDSDAEVESVGGDSGFTATTRMGQTTLRELLPAHRWGSIGTGLSLGASAKGDHDGDVTPVAQDDADSVSDGSYFSDEEDAQEAMDDLVDMQQQMRELMLNGTAQSAAEEVEDAATAGAGGHGRGGGGGASRHGDDEETSGLGSSTSSFADPPPLASGDVSAREQTLQRLRQQATRLLGSDFDAVYNYLLTARRNHVRVWKAAGQRHRASLCG